MPRNDTLHVLQDSLKLWLYLPSTGRGKTVQEIKKDEDLGLSIDQGQIRKRLKALESAGFVESRREGHQQYWISRGATAELSRWREDVVSNALFQQLRELVPAPFFEALAKRAPKPKRSEARMEQARVRWPERVFVRQAGFSLMPPQMRGEFVDIVLKAMSEDAGLEGDYMSARSSVHQPKIIAPPIGLLSKGNLMYLVSVNREEPGGLQLSRLRLDRFRALRVKSLPPVVTVEEFKKLTSSGLSDFGESPERFRAWASPEMTSVLESQPLADGMQIIPVDPDSPRKGSYVTVPSMLLGFHFDGYLIDNSADLVCLEPLDKRTDIIKRLSGAVDALSVTITGAANRRKSPTGEVTLKAWVDNKRGESYCETPFCPGASVIPNSSEGESGYTLEAKLHLTRDVENYIAAQAEGFIVHSPADLRARILARHRAGLAAYKKHSPKLPSKLRSKQ